MEGGGSTANQERGPQEVIAMVQKHAEALVTAASGASGASGLPVLSTSSRQTLLHNRIPQWAERAANAQPTYTAAVEYIAQRVAAACCPHVTVYDDVVLTKLPVMLHSSFCVLRNQPPSALREMGECPYEKGGYFIVRGKEKVIISQESYLRNIIQMRVERVQAPPSYTPPSTLILYQGESKPTPDDQEEVFEAQINCSDDPRPPVMVKLHFKRLYQYARGGGTLDTSESLYDDGDPQQQQLHEMRKAMNFRGLYLTLHNRKGDKVLEDFPLFLFFRAMGVTKPVRTQSPSSSASSASSAPSAPSASSNERLSDREIIECILGVDTSGTVSVEVPLDQLRPLCGADGTQGWIPGTTNVWYTPRGDGDCAWVILPKAPSGRVTGFGVGDTALHTPSHTFACCCRTASKGCAFQSAMDTTFFGWESRRQNRPLQLVRMVHYGPFPSTSYPHHPHPIRL